MTDDIVTRLRDLAMKEESPWANIYDNVMRDAADEIERLKRILRHVASNNPSWADPDMECRTCSDIVKEFGR